MDAALREPLQELEAFGRSNDAAVVERSRRMLNITRDTGEFLSLLVRAARSRPVLARAFWPGAALPLWAGWLEHWAPQALSARILAAMAIPHVLPGEVVDITPLGARLANERTSALFKSTDLEVMRLVLAAGKSLPAHKVPGEITIQCVEGAMVVTAEGNEHALRAGQLLYLRGGCLHSVRAIEDTSALVTVALTTH